MLQEDFSTFLYVTLGHEHAAARAVIVLDGMWRAAAVAEPLNAWDCLVAPAAAELRGDGTLACVTFRSRSHEGV